MKSVTIASVIQNNDTTQAPAGKVEKKSGKRVGYNYIIVKSLKESQKNDVVKCLYIKSLTSFGFCVIKEGTRGDTKDKHGRDIRDRLIWQQRLHAELQDKVRMPRLLGHFEEHGNYYLVLERIKGQSLYKACRDAKDKLRIGLLTGTRTGRAFANYLVQIADLLITLHEHGVVHRDATSNNFMIMPRGKVAVIDMELSYSLQQLYPSPPFQLGTHGYMAPQQLRTEVPTIEEDVFAFGAVLLQVWTGFSPSKITDVPMEALQRKVHFLVPDQAMAGIILQCLQPSPTLRPALSSVQQVLQQYQQDLKTRRPRAATTPPLYSRAAIQDTLQATIHTQGSPLLADAQKGWFGEVSDEPANKEKTKISKAWYASFYKGAAGPLYFLSQAHTQGLDTGSVQTPIQQTLDIIEQKYIRHIEQKDPGLHFGSTGIAAALTTAMQSGLIFAEPLYNTWINQLLEKDSSDLFYTKGITGQGIARFICQPYADATTSVERLNSYVHQLLAQQQPDGSWVRPMDKKENKKDKKYNKKTRGFSNGVAGITWLLLHYAQQYRDAQALAAAQRSLQFLQRIAVRKQQKLYWLSNSKKELPLGWWEGTAGIALTFLKAWDVTKEPAYRSCATAALLSHDPQLMDNNLGQSHGLCGLGEVYLQAWQLFRDEQWLQRAGWIAQVVMHLQRQHPQHGPYWLVAHEREPLADFMNGNSGILHFLLRYSFPEAALPFPLLP